MGDQVQGDTDEAAAITGIAMSATIGSVTATAIVNTGWGRASGNGPWNDNAFVPIADLTGIQMTAAIGTVTATAEVSAGWGRAAIKYGVYQTKELCQQECKCLQLLAAYQYRIK